MIRLLRYTFLLSIFLFLKNSGIAQDAMHVGVVGGSCNDLCSVSGNSNNLYKVRCQSYTYGLSLRQELTRRVSVETGFYYKTYVIGFGVNANSLGSIEYNSERLQTILIPMQINRRLFTLKKRISLVASLGYVFGMNASSLFNSPDSSTPGSLTPNKFISGSDSLLFYVNAQKTANTNFSLIQTGISLEIKLFKSVLVNIYSNYCFGFKRLISGDINYSINNKSYYGNFYVNGTYSKFGISVYLPIRENKD